MQHAKRNIDQSTRKHVRKELPSYMKKLYSKSIRLVKIVQFAFFPCQWIHAKRQTQFKSCYGKLICYGCIFAIDEEGRRRGKIGLCAFCREPDPISEEEQPYEQ